MQQTKELWAYMYKPLVVTVMIILDEVNMNVGLFLIMHIYTCMMKYMESCA